MDTMAVLTWVKSNWLFIAIVIVALYVGMAISSKSSRPGAAGSGPDRPILQNVIDQAVFFGQILGFLVWTLYYLTVMDPTKFTWPIQGVVWVVCGLFGFLHPIALPMLISWITPRDPMESELLDQSKNMSWYWVQESTTWITAGVSLFMLFGWLGSAMKVSDIGNRALLTVMFTVLTSLIPSFAWIHAAPDSWKAHYDRMRQARVMKALHAAELIKIKADFHMEAARFGSMALSQVVNDRPDVFPYVEAVFKRMNENLIGIQHILASLIWSNAHILNEEDEKLRQGGFEVTMKLIELQEVLDNQMIIHTEKQTKPGMVVSK